MTDYADFLARKAIAHQPEGIPADRIPVLNERLFPFQRDIVRWSLERGRCAIFAECGLGKTWMALEWAQKVVLHTRQHVLILTPLAVAAQFVREGQMLWGEDYGMVPVHVREPEDIPEKPCTLVCNYERLEKILPALRLGGVVLDESSILKAYDGKTRTMLIEAFQQTPFRLACTATPSPNDVTELGNHAEFLGAMSRVEMLATFFCHDGGDTSKWRLKGHAEGDFWSWVRTWAVCLSKPSDMGYSDEGYVLPPLRLCEHVIDVDQRMARQAGLLFAFEATTLAEQREVKKSTLDERCSKAAFLVNASPGQWLVFCDLNDESAALTKSIPGAVEVKGSDSAEHKESSILDFAEGRIRVLVSKSSIVGFGVNLQICSQMVFVGADHSYEKFHQSVRRCWRFGQAQPVDAHLVRTSADGRVAHNLERKRLEHEAMVKGMVSAVESNIGRVRVGHVEGVSEQGRGWEMRQGDCVELVREMVDDSVGFSVYSPPFASLYTYSDSDRDMGNCRDHDEFFEHYTFLLRELLRVTKPGRLSSVHCMIMPTSKVRDGVIGLTDFPGRIIRAHEAAGWVYHSDVVVWKDPVTAMQRTKALGLLWKQIQKDSCMSRMGLPDRVVTFRKPGVNADPVGHSKAEFPVDQWQRWASPVWDDINPSDTLQYQSAREEKDERHICPLQLDVIRRCVRLWSNPGDLVLSPFGGIGSEGYVALQERRAYLGCELKPSYFQQAVANLRAAESTTRDLFGALQSGAGGTNLTATG
jgi:superfamily II DNA or RNA helicase